MNNTLQEADELLSAIIKALNQDLPQDVTVIIAPAFPFIISPALTNLISSNNKDQLFLAAQNCHQESKGAYTGEVSAQMIRSAGADFVIIGHSERRQYYHEDNTLLAKKVDAAIAAGLMPIYCCGELLEDRKAENQFEVVKQQISEGLFHLDSNTFSKVIIAYEPVWAIGTGETATSEQAQEMHSFIRAMVSDKYGEVSENCSILYGGSCNPSNAKELFSQSDIDGGLIGGASLNVPDFVTIIHSF